jgi:hypothetical protein
MLEEKQSQRAFRTVFCLRSPHTLSKATKSSNATRIIAIFIGQNPAAVKIRCCVGVMIFWRSVTSACFARHFGPALRTQCAFGRYLSA